MTAKHSGNDDSTAKIRNIINWIIVTLAGILGIIVTLINIPKKPVITVENSLALPIIITINDSYNNRIQPKETKTISMFSEAEFPANVKWKVQQNKNSRGQPLGEEIGEQIKLVDKGAKLKVDNEIGLNFYFYPVILNNTDSQCTIIVNDGLNIKYDIGASNPHTLTNITGYYKYATNSNVTLKCADQTYWLGKRNGKQSDGKINLSSGSGIIEVIIP